MTDVSLGVWSVAESPIAVEYSLDVLEQIRIAVQDGFQRLSRGGVEVGGVLYGVRQGRTVRILAHRPIHCEHARGPAFLLSDEDKAGLTALLDRGEPELQNFGVVGWYVSHTKSEVCLSESDLEIYSGYFAAPWQVTLVLRPGRYGGTRAGFFVREADGSVQAQRSYLDFNVPDRTPNSIERVPADRPHSTPADRTPQSRTQLLRASRKLEAQREAPAPPVEESSPRLPVRVTPPPFTPQPSKEVPRFATEPPRSWRWVWIVAWVLSLAATAYGVRWFLESAGTAEPLALQVTERDGQLQIEWNRAARTILAATRGTLGITDGAATKNIPLTTEDLSKGKFTYVRQAAEVQVKLTVYSPEGKPREESSRYLGHEITPKDSEEVIALRRQRDQLADEVKRLEAGAQGQAARIQQLERTIRILESRLNIRGKQ
ncbi:MAG: hypothetical protein ABI823_00725 [Bryobacteraceae bacterium]